MCIVEKNAITGCVAFFHRPAVLLLIFLLLLSQQTYSQVQLICQEAGDFNEGLAPFKIDDKWGFIDTEGNIVIPPVHKYHSKMPVFSSGLCAVMDDKGKFGFINTKGDTVIPFVLFKSTIFRGETAPVYFPASASQSNSTAHWGIMNKTGELISENTPNVMGYNTELIENRARIKKSNKYGYMDSFGNEIIPAKFEDVKDFSNGLAAVKLNRKWGFIDTSGNTVIDFQFNIEPLPFSEGHTFILGNNNKWAHIDKDLNFYSEALYDLVFPYSEGFAIVCVVEKHKYIFSIVDRNNKVIKTFSKPLKGKDLAYFTSPFKEGMAVVRRGTGAEYGYADTSGKLFFDFRFSRLHPYSGDRAYAEYYDRKNKKLVKGFINKQGEYVILLEEKKL